MDLDELKARRLLLAQWQPESQKDRQNKATWMLEIEAEISREEDFDDRLHRRWGHRFVELQEREQKLIAKINGNVWISGAELVPRSGPDSETLHELTIVRETMGQLRRKLDRHLAKIRTALATVETLKIEPNDNARIDRR